MPSIIQFIHPGGEHGYDVIERNKYKKNWHILLSKNGKKLDHQRKFMVNEGSYIENDILQKGKLLFWGEWEPTSLVETLNQPQIYIKKIDRYPEYLHFPYLPPKETIKQYQDENRRNISTYQNTDPFIFGNNFRYAICHQKHYTRLKNLEIGSLILFGSSIDSRFVIDTVFVVGDKKTYNTSNIENIGCDDTFYPEIVLKMTCKNDKSDGEQYTLYYGATYKDRAKFNGMFSFVPAKKYSGEKQGFPRFYFSDDFYNSENNKLNKYISKGLTQGIKSNSEYKISINEVKVFWEYIKNEVSKNYILGINFEMPNETILKI